ncbi:MAG: hypothetical protein ACRBB0_14895 [Pelagimonas sp.]|uniref:hypothetical protein n=1 Tax=Pelagimonas sp. TaxID=2073170 RepID=UPI003D6BF7FF
MRAEVACFIGTPPAQHELRIIRCWGDGLGNEVEHGEKKVLISLQKSDLFAHFLWVRK